MINDIKLTEKHSDKGVITQQMTGDISGQWSVNELTTTVSLYIHATLTIV